MAEKVAQTLVTSGWKRLQQPAISTYLYPLSFINYLSQFATLWSIYAFRFLRLFIRFSDEKTQENDGVFTWRFYGSFENSDNRF